MVTQDLPAKQLFLIQPNQSYDGNPLDDDEEVFPQDSLHSEEALGPLGSEAAAEWLWRQGKIPEWIDIRAFDANAVSSVLWLTCCGRFTALRERLYHEQEGNQPFHVTSPILPIEWESVEVDGRFDLEAQRATPTPPAGDGKSGEFFRRIFRALRGQRA